MAKLRINILDDKDYLDLDEKVGVTKKELEDSLGFADQKSGDAYIRKTGVDGIDEATIMHEIDELLVGNEEHKNSSGLYFKKWGKPFRALTGTGASQSGTIFGNVLPTAATIGLGAVPGIGPALSTGYGAYRGSQEGGGVKGGLLGALGGYGLGNVGSGISGGIKGAMAGTGFLKGVTKGLSEYGLNPMISKALGLGATTNVAGATEFPKPSTLDTSKFLTPEYIGQPTRAGGYLGTIPLKAEGYSPPAIAATAPAAATTSPALGALSGIASPVAQTLLGAGLTGASTMPKQAQFENVASLDQLRNEIATKGSSPALYMRARRALEEGYEDASSEIDTLYNQAGMLDSGEYRDAKAKLAAKKADANELLAAQIDEQTMNDLLGLTGLDVAIAAQKYNADANDIATLRQILGYTGGTMLTTGLKGLGVTQ